MEEWINSWPNLQALTFTIAGALVFVRPIRRCYAKLKEQGTGIKCWETEHVILDFLNGACLMPFLGMIIPLFHPPYFKQIEDNMLLMATAGGIGVFFVLGVIFAKHK